MRAAGTKQGQRKEETETNVMHERLDLTKVSNVLHRELSKTQRPRKVMKKLRELWAIENDSIL
jgi:hypothetical protein